MQKPWNEGQEYSTYHDALEQIELADKLGFDHVWEVEHHFLTEYSHSSAPEVFLAAASQRTKNIRIGHGVALLPYPFNHPIRVAERAAALDIMSNGRLEFGTGRSITEQELGGFGIDPADSRPMWEEAIQMIPKMWTEETFSWEGTLRGAAAERHPEADPEASPADVDGLHAAGELPDRGLEGPGRALVRVHRAGHAGGVARDYREASKTRSRWARSRTTSSRPRRSPASRRRTRRRSSTGARRRSSSAVDRDPVCALGEEGERAGVLPVLPDVAQMAEARLKHGRPEFEDSWDSGACAWAPRSAAASVVQKYADTGVDQLILMVQVGRIPHEKVMQTIRLFGEEIIPAFR